jgi:hypothetical protein
MLFYCGIERVPKWPMAGAPLHSEKSPPKLSSNFHPFTALPLSLSPSLSPPAPLPSGLIIIIMIIIIIF